MFVLLLFSLPVALADEDEYEEEEDEMRFGFGEMEREREREHQDDELAIGSGTADLVLYVTIGAIIASIGYTGFKILKTKRAQNKKLR